jgi:Amt family ammonium transporter
MRGVEDKRCFFSETKLFLTQLTGMVGVSIFAFGDTWPLLKLTD